MVAMRRQGDLPPSPLDWLLDIAQWTLLLAPPRHPPLDVRRRHPTRPVPPGRHRRPRTARLAPPLPPGRSPRPHSARPSHSSARTSPPAASPHRFTPPGRLSPQGAEVLAGGRHGNEQQQQFRASLGFWSTDVPTSLSLNPAATRYELALLALAVSLFLLGSQVFTSRRTQSVLWGAFAANGALFAFYGLTQQLTWSGKIYGQYALSQGGHPFAAFVNKNNGAGYLNLCLAAALGYLLYAYTRSTSDHRSSPHPLGSRTKPRPANIQLDPPAAPAHPTA
jgi:hypothetical protein